LAILSWTPPHSAASVEQAVRENMSGVSCSKVEMPMARPATSADAEAIARIYNEGIEDRIATFETDPRSRADIERLLADREGKFPTVVVERGGQVVAWASAGTYRSRPCYDPIAEHSVYVARDQRGSGAGRIALEALCARAEALGYLKLVSRIFPENLASLALHRKVGFREVGIYHRHGKLDGRWRDCVIVEKLLGEAAAE
jgi:phosphinothricin acetyltransferase